MATAPRQVSLEGDRLFDVEGLDISIAGEGLEPRQGHNGSVCASLALPLGRPQNANTDACFVRCWRCEHSCALCGRVQVNGVTLTLLS